MVSPVMIKNLSAIRHHRAIGCGDLLPHFGSSFYLQRFHGWDRTSRCWPEARALSQVIMLATERNADVAASRWCRSCG